jgi:hypothetical protein
MSGVATTCRELLDPAELDDIRNLSVCRARRGACITDGCNKHSVKWLCSESSWCSASAVADRQHQG